MSSRTRLAAVLLLAFAVGTIVAGNALSEAGAEQEAGWLVAGGFVLCGIAFAVFEVPIEASVLSIVLALYVGFSAALAADFPARDATDGPAGFGSLAPLPFVRLTSGAPKLAAWAFFPTLKLASACGLLALVAIALAGQRRPAPERTASIDRSRLLQASGILIWAGVLGAALAALRFAVENRGHGLSATALESFWHGGAYLIFVAQFAIPGFGLRLSLLLDQRASRRLLIPTVAGFVVFLLLSIATGERGFMIEGGLVILAVTGTHRERTRRLILPAVLVGLGLLVITQAARDSLRDEHTVNPASVSSLLFGKGWERSLENQFASFQWAADLRAYGPALHGANPLLALAAKPIPRQLWPAKPEGLGHEFTAAVYPSATAAGVSFAIPLYAELDFAIGAGGALAGFALLGAMLAASWRLSVRWPSALRPVSRCMFLWAAFVLVRGDLSNTVPLAVAAMLALAFIVWWARVSKPQTLVIDALAVPVSYSGVGAATRMIGDDLRRHSVSLPIRLVVRCAADVRQLLAVSFPADTTFETPLASSRPAWLRFAYQLGVAPIRDRRSTILLSASEIGPWWGQARRALIVYDLRRRVAPETASRLEGRLYSLLVPRAVRGTEAILTASEATRASLESELAPAAEITVVALHSGLEPRACPGPGAEPTLIVVSAVRRYKGAELVLDALAQLPLAGRPQVIWAGAVELAADEAIELRQRASALGLELLGWVPDEQLEAALDRATGLLAPSRFEGYGLSLLEGLRRGKPILAADIPAHREVAGDAALYFDPDDPSSLSGLLSRVASGTPALDQIAELSRQRAVQLASATPSWTEALLQLVERFSYLGRSPELPAQPLDHAGGGGEAERADQAHADAAVHG